MREFEFEGVVRLTRMGGGYLLFTLVVGFAALNTGNNALYIALAFMLSTLIVSGVASKSGLRRIEIELLDVGEAWVGRPTHGTLQVRNRSRIWKVRDMVIISPEMDDPVVIPILARRSDHRVPVRFLFSRRGRIDFNRIDLYTRYPFGLFVKKRRLRIEGNTVVYPRLLDHSVVPEVRVSRPGEAHNARHRGTGGEPYAFREYVRGDSVRQLHWKKSAGQGRWIVRESADEVNRAIRMVVDGVLPAGMDPERFERMISEAATSIYEAFEEGLEVAVSLPGARLEGSDPESRRAIFEALALLQARSSGPIPPHDRGAFIFSLRTDDEAKSA